jgi:hypothetical protein
MELKSGHYHKVVQLVCVAEFAMFKRWEVSPQWKLSSRAAIWGAVAWALAAGILMGVLWTGMLPFDLLRGVSLAVLLVGIILLVVRFVLPRIQR